MASWVIIIEGPSIAPRAALEPATTFVVLGLIVAWAGIALRRWAFATLGHYFTFVVMTSDDQPVIESGPYRYVRHPSYSAIILIIMGFALMFGNWASLIAALVLALVGVIIRIHVEERALHARLGDRYRRYAATRKRLIPLVW